MNNKLIFNKLYLLVFIFTFCFGFYSYTLLGQQPKQIKKPKNVIIMIGDGMGTAQIYAALTVKKDRLNIARCKNIGFHKTYSSDSFITDSGAGGTAISTGSKTKNGYIAMDSSKKPLKTILEKAEDNKLSTGIVVACAVTHATPAAFIAHVPDRELYEDIATWYTKTDIDVFIGGGRKYFENRSDKRNLTDSLIKRNYQLIYDLNKLSTVTNGKLAALLYENHPPKATENRGNMLSISSSKALSLLEKNKKGFFMMIEGSQIDWAGHDNDEKYLLAEMLDFDDAVGVVLDYAQKNGETLVIITGDHETGGYSILGGDWNAGKVSGKFSTNDHSAVMVPIFSFGPGSENFTGIMENTDIFHKVNQLLFGNH